MMGAAEAKVAMREPAKAIAAALVTTQVPVAAREDRHDGYRAEQFDGGVRENGFPEDPGGEDHGAALAIRSTVWSCFSQPS